MALNFQHGSIDWLTTDVLSSTKTVTGLGFTPKAIRFYWIGIQSTTPTNANSQAINQRRGVGFASSTTSRAAVGTYNTDNATAADCGSAWINDGCVVTVSGAGAIDGRLDINSIDTDGFTLIVDDVTPANITVFWEAWGGDDITNVTIGAIAEPAAIGTQTYTATGFIGTTENSKGWETQCVMFAGVQTVNASGTGQAQDSGLHVGFSGGYIGSSIGKVCVVGNSDDGSATMDTDGFNTNVYSLAMITIAGGNPNALAEVVPSTNNDVFSLDWLARATTNRRSIYMAIKGGYWGVGDVTIDGNTLNSTTTISDVSFNIRGISLIGAMKTTSAGATSTVQDRIGFGSGTSTTSRRSMGILDENGTAKVEVDFSIYYDQVLVYPSNAGGLQTAYDISNLSGNSVTLITDIAGGVASEMIGYLIFGDVKKSSASIGHPFIT